MLDLALVFSLSLCYFICNEMQSRLVNIKDKLVCVIHYSLQKKFLDVL